MIVNTPNLQHFLPYIKNLPEPDKLQKSDLIQPNFLIEKSDDLEMYYAPHNEVVNREAKLVIVGITPGWTQMKLAFRQAKYCLQRGDSIDQVVKSCKTAARFAGSMRKLLIDMLDDCGINVAFNLSSCQGLFEPSCNLLHTTSVIKYPVFMEGKNYTGFSPRVDQSPLLKTYAYQVFPDELRKIESEFLLVPLGKSVAEVIKRLVEKGEISGTYCLFGFPHPSGANGHRKKQFTETKSYLRSVVKAYTKQQKTN